MSESSLSRQAALRAQVMLLLMVACLPGIAALWFYFGWGVVINLLWLPALAVACEALALKVRKVPVLPQLRDCSALLTGLLLALAMPPAAPWWLGLVGAVIAIALAKQLYGGSGRNVLNPAMAGHAALLLLFPAPMARWLLPEGATYALPSFVESLQLFAGLTPDAGIDAFVGATALDSFRHERGGQLVAEFAASSPLMGQWSGLGWEWINGGFLLGGLYLVYRRVISWHIPAATLAALAVAALLFHDGGSSASHGSPLFHLFAGGTMLGAFFIATDPVTAPATSRGKLFYGAMIGVLVFMFRAWSPYPDGVAFAVLLGNLAAPLLDAVARPAAVPRFVPERSWKLTTGALAGVVLFVSASNLFNGSSMATERALLDEVMPSTFHDNNLAGAAFTLDPADASFTNLALLGISAPRSAYRALQNGSVSGVILPLVAPRGYNGAIELLVGIGADGEITGVRVMAHNETRGFAELDADSNWLRAFDNRSLANTDDVLWAIKQDGGDFDQFVGATITPRATVTAIYDALRFFELNKDRLLAE